MNDAIATINAATTTANAAKMAYINHWIRLNCREEIKWFSDIRRIAELALKGMRICLETRRIGGVEVPLIYPTVYENHANKMSQVQFETSKTIAGAYKHLWSWGSAYDWADHYNRGFEDGFCWSNHPLPVAEDYTSSNRFSWKVLRDGSLTFQVNRPAGTACRVTGTLEDFKIEIFKIAEDRHLNCLYQALADVFGIVANEEAIEMIESAKGFRLCGIRYGELHKYLRLRR